MQGVGVEKFRRSLLNCCDLGGSACGQQPGVLCAWTAFIHGSMGSRIGVAGRLKGQAVPLQSPHVARLTPLCCRHLKRRLRRWCLDSRKAWM